MKKKNLFISTFVCFLPLSAQLVEDGSKVVSHNEITIAPAEAVKISPNSYIFDPYQNNYDGFYIPVEKAYAMWQSGAYMGTGGVYSLGEQTADVFWEDTPGLIKSGANYSLEIIGTGLNAKIKIPVNKSKEGNAVIAFRMNGEIFWSWHVWITDDPTNGSNHKSYTLNLNREKSDGTLEPIPDSDWGWMDRNLGALSSSITQDDWNKNGGLLYQWGRKDPFPPLALKGNDMYAVAGSVGRVRHRNSANNIKGSLIIDDLTKYVLLSNANVTDNIRLSVKNPLSLIYVNKNDNSGQAYYNNSTNLPYNWFGTYSALTPEKLGELNLWSDNSKGTVRTTGNTSQNYHNYNSNARPYRNKSSYDPCPNGWRVPSMIIANLSNAAYVDNIRIDFSPFGLKNDTTTKDVFMATNDYIIKPNDVSVPAKLKGVKLYPSRGFNMSNVGGNDMGIFPGTGQLIRKFHAGQYADQHHTSLWTATMVRHSDTTPSVSARSLMLLPDNGQPDIPDPSFPGIKGRYIYDPLSLGDTSDANGCRCIKDPLYIVNGYDFPTEYYTEPVSYTEGLYQPNSYQIVKNTAVSTIEVPVSKAFSAQSILLDNQAILNTSSFNDLKANVLWTDNSNLINKVTIINPTPGSLAALSSTRIKVEVKANQSGNAVITLHNGSIANPVYWSWHIWVTDSSLATDNYLTEMRNMDADNYINYVTKGEILKTEFMDRYLGAKDVFPSVFINPSNPTTTELSKVRASTGLHYQWGRKDPFPVFKYADNRSDYNIYLGTVNSSGGITYTTLTASAFNNLSGNYIIPYNTYTNAANANLLPADKLSDKISKVLSYSVKNPLVYMIPSTFATYAGNNTLGTDWLANESGLAPERWGRGGVKSPFDPCPDGWRIPDYTYVGYSSGGDYGISPWYKKDLNVGGAHNIITDYLGFKVSVTSSSAAIGYVFNDASYEIGSYTNSGSRAARNVTANDPTTGTFNTINHQYPGIWTAALNESRGRPINLVMDAVSNNMVVFNDSNDTYFGLSCRCVKIKYDENGNEEGVIPRLPVEPFLPASTKLSGKNEFDTKLIQKDIVLFPNPVDTYLYIEAQKGSEYHYQIYGMNGNLIKTGVFIDDKVDMSSLTTGVYIIRINSSEKIFKIIKK